MTVLKHFIKDLIQRTNRSIRKKQFITYITACMNSILYTSYRFSYVFYLFFSQCLIHINSIDNQKRNKSAIKER